MSDEVIRWLQTMPIRRPEAVIVDVDGTLCNVTSVRHHVLNRPKDFDAFHREAETCPPHQQAIDFCWKHFQAGRDILFVTGRMEMWRASTQTYIFRTLPGMRVWGPWMRPQGDYRPDVEVKTDIFNQIAEYWDVVAAIDDNPNIIALWKGLGIPTEVVPGWDHEAAASYVDSLNNHGAQP